MKRSVIAPSSIPASVSTCRQPLNNPPVLEIDACPPEVEYPKTKIPRHVLRENFAKSAREICEYASDKNVPIAIEPINRFEGYAGFLNSIVEARSIADEVGLGLGVLLDFFHVNIEDGPVAETILVAGEKLRHLHLADSNRQMPGTGTHRFCRSRGEPSIPLISTAISRSTVCQSSQIGRRY